MFLAYLLSSRPVGEAVLPEPEAVRAKMAERTKGVSVRPNDHDGQLVIEASGVAVALQAVATPMPLDPGSTPGDNPMWKNAATELPTQRQHVIATVLPGSGEVPKLAEAAVMTLVLYAVAELVPGTLAVCWAAHGRFASRETLDLLVGHGLEGMTKLWTVVSVHPDPDQPGRSRGFTQGLRPFGCPDFGSVDANEPADELVVRLEGLIAYVLPKGPVIRDGETIGESAQERIRVREAASPFGHDEPILLLEYDAPAPKRRGWFRRRKG